MFGTLLHATLIIGVLSLMLIVIAVGFFFAFQIAYAEFKIEQKRVASEQQQSNLYRYQ